MRSETDRTRATDVTTPIEGRSAEPHTDGVSAQPRANPKAEAGSNVSPVHAPMKPMLRQLPGGHRVLTSLTMLVFDQSIAGERQIEYLRKTGRKHRRGRQASSSSSSRGRRQVSSESVELTPAKDVQPPVPETPTGVMRVWELGEDLPVHEDDASVVDWYMSGSRRAGGEGQAKGGHAHGRRSNAAGRTGTGSGKD